MTNIIKITAISTLAAFALSACGGTDTSGGATISAANKTEAGIATAETAVIKDVDAKDDVSEDVMKEGAAVNAPYNAFLSKYVVPTNGINLVKYSSVTDADHKVLKAYIETLSNTDSSEFNQNETMAYWFNLYNAETLNVVLDHYPVSSIKKIDSGPWNEKRMTVNDKKMSLDNIEHDTVRANYDEPRVHFAFNCGSIGCPNLKTTAWEAATLDVDLTQAAKDYVASPRGVTVDGDKIMIASIFKWYKEDFGDSEKDTLTYLAQYATGAKKSALQNAKKVNKFEYDWDLNQAK